MTWRIVAAEFTALRRLEVIIRLTRLRGTAILYVLLLWIPRAAIAARALVLLRVIVALVWIGLRRVLLLAGLQVGNLQVNLPYKLLIS